MASLDPVYIDRYLQEYYDSLSDKQSNGSAGGSSDDEQEKGIEPIEEATFEDEEATSANN